MTSLTILFKEIEIDGKKKMDIQMYNFRADNATTNEKLIASQMEPEVLEVLTRGVKNPVHYMSSRWEDELDIKVEKK